MYLRRGGDRQGRGRTAGEHNLMVRWIKHPIICSPQSGLFLLYVALCRSSSSPSTQYSRFLAGCPPNFCFLTDRPILFCFSGEIILPWTRPPGPRTLFNFVARYVDPLFLLFYIFFFFFAPHFILLLIFIALGGRGFWRVVRWPSHDIAVDVTTPHSHDIFDGVVW